MLLNPVRACVRGAGRDFAVPVKSPMAEARVLHDSLYVRPHPATASWVS